MLNYSMIPALDRPGERPSSGYTRVEFEEAEPLNPPKIADLIYASSRNYRTDHCAIFIDPDSPEDFLRDSGLQTSLLVPDESWHWTGAKSRKNLHRVMVAEYEDWFRWFMKWQRFNAFQILVLVNPIKQIVDFEGRGYIDGLLTRLLTKPSVHKIIVLEQERFQPMAKEWFGSLGQTKDLADLKEKLRRRQFNEAIASILYGTHLSTSALLSTAARTLYSKVNPSWQSDFQEIKRRPALVDRLCRSKFTAGYHAREMVESLKTPEARESLEDPEQPLPPLFTQAKERGPSELSQEWLERLTHALLDSRGWFTIPMLYEYVYTETQKLIQSSKEFPGIFNDHYDDEAPSDTHVFLPSRPALRGIADRLAAEGKVRKAQWSKEIGRPATIYHLPDRLPFNSGNKCGQCAFYVPLRRQCRIWWLLNRSYGHFHPRWARDGERPLSAFETYKMRNSWRIGPHSSACTRFVDKKKDYTRKALPKLCDVCQDELPGMPLKGSMVVCKNCRTRYFMLRNRRVKVLTSYEHEFEKTYHELAGVEPASDIKRLIEESMGTAASIVERAVYEDHRGSSEDPDSTPKTVMLFQGDRMLAGDGMLYIFKRRSVELLPLAGSTLVDQGHVVSEEQRGILESAGMTVRSTATTGGAEDEDTPLPNRYDIAPAVEKVVASHPEFLRKMSLAMAQSCIHATERIGPIAKIRDEDILAITRRQKLWMRRLENEPPSRFLVYEAAVMREYWNCYYLPLKAAFQRSGPRKKARFVREYVADPVGRARGYTAVDAAINYLHQRRLFKASSINMQLGLDYNPGEGFLHRKRWNPEGFGLILDLIDPFKFADREKLLGVILDVSLNWRDFYSATDRHGARFYYPKPEAVGVMEKVGEAADGMLVSYDGVQMALAEAYRNTVSALIQNLQAGTPTAFVPFTY